MFACLAALGNGAVQAQVAYTYWHLTIANSTATLTSHFDYEAPEGMLEAFTCTRGSSNVAVAQFVHDSGGPDMKTVVRTAQYSHGCDLSCRTINAKIYEDEQRPMVKRLRPIGSYNSEVHWSRAKPMLFRRLKDVQQFGDAPELEIKAGIKSNLNDLERFRVHCELAS